MKMTSKKPINITYGQLVDLKEIVDFNFKIFQGMYEDEPYSLNQYQEKLKDQKPLILIATKDKVMVGDSISFGREESFYIWILGVDKKHRGEGIGSLLLEKNEKFAQDNGYKSVSTKVYNVSKEMQALLKQRGYQVLATEDSDIDQKNNYLKFELKF